MRMRYNLLVLTIFTVQMIPLAAQEDTTRKEKDFKYLFGRKESDEKEEPRIKSDTLTLADFYDMSLEELEDLKASGVSSELEEYINSLLSVSTQKSLPSRYAPNIVTLVTEEEIKAMGAHDLIDVLFLVPGFHFAQDIKGNVGLGIRGNWAAEGKVLIMINGREINEHYTAHTYFGNHFPVEMIKRIEIIRGPGSSVYGGFAEFGVINIVTKTPEDFSGIGASINQGYMGNHTNRGKFNFYVGKKWRKTDLVFWLATGNAQRSNRSHYGFYNCAIDSLVCKDSLGVGAYVPLAQQSALDNFTTNLTFNWGNFSITNLLDYYAVTDVTSLDSRQQRPLKYGYFSAYNELKYKFRVTPNLTITPKINMNIQTPAESNTPYANALLNDPASFDTLVIAINRFRARLDINYDISHRVNLIGGVDFFHDRAINADTVSQLYEKEAPDQYSSTAFYTEAIFRLPVFHLFAGARLETNSSYPAAFSPRVGITRKFNRFHLKFLVTDAYRLPTLGNIYYSFDGTYSVKPDSSGIYNVGRGLVPEKTLVIEAEAGYQFSNKTFLTLNLFDMTIRDPIVYTYYQDETVSDIYGPTSGLYVYQNFSKSGTRGLEVDFRFQDKWGYLNANYSFYTVANKPKIKAYSVSTFHRNPDNRILVESDYLLAFPKHKLNISWLYHILPDFTVNINTSFIGIRYGYDVDVYGPGPWDVDGKLIKDRFTYLVNFFFRYDNLLTPGLSAGLGMNNVFNQQYDYLQPYFGLKPPLPGASREFKFTLGYQLPFHGKKNKE